MFDLGFALTISLKVSLAFREVPLSPPFGLRSMSALSAATGVKFAGIAHSLFALAGMLTLALPVAFALPLAFALSLAFALVSMLALAALLFLTLTLFRQSHWGQGYAAQKNENRFHKVLTPE
jgi:hypothetical protein